jgi:hypothetical protein
MDVGRNDFTPRSQRFSWDDLNTDDNCHDDENDVTNLMVDNKKDSVQVDTCGGNGRRCGIVTEGAVYYAKKQMKVLMNNNCEL